MATSTLDHSLILKIKKTTIPERSANDWLSVLAAGQHTPEVVPHGWKTTDQVAQETGKSASTTRLMLKNAMSKGLVDCQKFRIMTGDKRYPVPHYRIK